MKKINKLRKKEGNRTHHRNKKAQITIYIIIAILFISLIVLVVSLRRKPVIDIHSELNPSYYIEKCARDYSKEAVDIMLPQGGYISPENYKLYDGNKAAYLCYNKNYYQPCVNQIPLYIQHLENEIKSYIEPKIESCFFSLKQELEKRNYVIELESSMSINIELVPQAVRTEIKRTTSLTKGEETQKYEDFETKISSPLYDLANVAREVVNQEAKYCNFEYVGYSMFYPKFKIEKRAVGSASDSSKIYIIEDKATGKKLYFAVRSCAIPPGL